MTPRARREAEEECRALVVRLTHAADHGDAAGAAALFAPDGSWLRGGKVLTGHAAIRASIESRAGHTVRHLVSSTLIEVGDDAQATGVSYYVALRGSGEPRPFPMELPFSMGEWHDRFVKTAEGWRFAHRDVQRLFERRD